jgi:signal peptidase I
MFAQESGYKYRRKPLAAAALSLIMAGLGQIYCGKIIKGLIFAFLCTVLLAVTVGLATLPIHSAAIKVSFMLITALALPVVSLVAVIDSWYLARHTKPDYELKEYNRWYVYLLLCLINMGGSTTYSLYFRDHYMEAFRVPTASNYPTIALGDRFLANKLAYRNKDPKRGDLVVFVSPQNRRVNFVKRVVALAGDTVEIKDNDLYVNGQKLERTKIDDSILGKIKIEVQGKMLEGDVCEETNNGAKYKIFLVSKAEPNSPNFAKVTVPDYHCFVLGDNRDMSEDSRHFGPVPLATIKARADYLYWPAKDWSRFGRLDPR